MRGLVILFGLLAFASATPLLENLDPKNKQILIMKLLNHVLQPCMYQDIIDIGSNYDIEANKNMYTKVDVVKRFMTNYKLGMLPQGEIFTLHVDRQMKEVINTFHLLYYAKDFDAFLKTACWLRLHCNEGIFVYALTVAVRQRNDCTDIILPPPYEIYPYFFVRADVIQKAYMLKMKKGMLDTQLTDFYGVKVNEKDVYMIDENRYDTRVYLNEEDRLRYFTEDIDLNTYYYYFHMDFPFWMEDDLLMMNKFKIRRGELMLYVYQQLLARYNLERYANNLGEIDTISFYQPVKTGFWPWLSYHTGVEMPVRYNNYVVLRDDNEDDVLTLLEDYEVIIRDAVLKGFLITHDGVRIDLHKNEGMEALGQIIYGKVDKYHGDLYRYLLILMQSVMGLNGLKSDKYFVVPTVFDHYQTALRDPVFYRLQKRLLDIVFLYKKNLLPYTREELQFPGVKINNIYLDKMVTYFEDYTVDMTNAVYLTEEELKKTKSDMLFYALKRRLNQKPFKINMDVISDKSVDCVIRMFMGPKYDHMNRLIDINRNRVNFVELDSYVYSLKEGKNLIERNSVDMHNLVKDRVKMRDFYQMVEKSDFNTHLFKNFHTGFPMNLLLPKGQVNGLEMMLYVIITPMRMYNMDFDVRARDQMIDFRFTTLMDRMPLGFPLDRHIDVSYFFCPNMKFVDFMIFHEPDSCNMKTRWENYILRNYNLKNLSLV